MVNTPKKARKNQFDTINSVLMDNKTTPKPRKQIYQENYQKNKEKKKAQQRERYQRQKELAERYEKQQQSKYYGAEAFKVLMSLKEYTELNQEKRKL
jgi:hypothetical protein